jgi:hypothetical protein
MNANFLIGKLMIIEEDPYRIWDALENNYGVGYFNSVIEVKMGMNSDYKDKLFQDFRLKLLETNMENENVIQKIQKEL